MSFPPRFDSITGIEIDTGETGQALRHKQAQRVYDGSVVIFINEYINGPMPPGMKDIRSWKVQPGDQNSFDLLPIGPVIGSGDHENVTGATQMNLNYVTNVPNPNHWFQLTTTDTNTLVNHFQFDEILNADAGLATGDVFASYFTFEIDTASGAILGIRAWFDDPNPRPSVGHVYFDPAQGYHLRGSDDALPNNRWIGFRTITPSDYVTKLGTFVKMKCCSGPNSDSYGSDPTSHLICVDQTLMGYNSTGCFQVLNANCPMNMNADIGQCTAYCDQDSASGNCDDWYTAYCAAETPTARLMDALCPCYLGTSFYTNYFNDLQGQVVGVSGLPNFPRCYYAPCANQLIHTTFAIRNSPSCPNVQQCIQVANVNNNGTINGNVVVSQSVMCQQEGFHANTGTGTTASSIFLWVGIAIAAVVLIIILFLIFRRKKPADEMPSTPEGVPSMPAPAPVYTAPAYAPAPAYMPAPRAPEPTGPLNAAALFG